MHDIHCESIAPNLVLVYGFWQSTRCCVILHVKYFVAFNWNEALYCYSWNC
jgi:hypothetical protein